MRRLRAEFLERTKRYGHRVVDVAEAVSASGRSRVVTNRIIDQMVGSGTSVGANTREADEAMSRKDFCKCLGTALKELGESRYWVEFVGDRGWIPSRRLTKLKGEGDELAKILNTMVSTTRRNDRTLGREGGDRTRRSV